MDDTQKLQLEKEADAQIERTMKKEAVFSKFRVYIPSLVLGGMWLILGLLRSLGVQWGVLKVLDFFTGAVNGLNGNAVGGMVGKALLLICVNAFLKDVILSDVSKQEKFKMFLTSIKDGLLSLIPMFEEITDILGLKTAKYNISLVLGVAGGVLVYPFITSDGSLTNSMVLVMLAITLIRQLQNNSGLFMVLMHWILSVFKKIDKNIADAFVTGMSTGFLLSLGIAMVGEIPGSGILIRKYLPYIIALLILGGCGIYILQSKKKKEEGDA